MFSCTSLHAMYSIYFVRAVGTCTKNKSSWRERLYDEYVYLSFRLCLQSTLCTTVQCNDVCTLTGSVQKAHLVDMAIHSPQVVVFSFRHGFSCVGVSVSVPVTVNTHIMLRLSMHNYIIQWLYVNVYKYTYNTVKQCIYKYHQYCKNFTNSFNFNRIVTMKHVHGTHK